MRGHIQRRGAESWRIGVHLGRDEATGRRRYTQRTVRGTKADAERALAKLLTEVDDRRYADPGSLTVAELVERFLELKARQVHPSTLAGYRQVARCYINPRMDGLRISRLRALDLDRFYASLLASGGRGGRPLSPRSVRFCHVLLRQALAQAKRWGLLSVNPAEDATTPKERRREITPPLPEQVIRLLARAGEIDPDFGVYLSVLAATGCRRGEATALRWRDLRLGDDGRGEILIACRHQPLLDGCARSSGSRASVCMTCATTSPRARGAAGTPIATISSRLGHRDRATTLNIYSHSPPALDQTAADVLGRLLDGPVAPVTPLPTPPSPTASSAVDNVHISDYPEVS